MEDPSADVRQSAYAVLGDVAIAIYEALDPYLPKLLPLLIRQLDLDAIPDTDDTSSQFNVLANVCWSLGEIAIRAPTSRISPTAEALLKALLTILSNEEVPDPAAENAATAIGRLGLACPIHLSPFLSDLADPFLHAMTKMSTSQEKASAFKGLNALIERNPAAMEKSLELYFSAIAQFPIKGKAGQEYAEIHTGFAQIVQGFKGLIGEGGNWDAFLARLSPAVRAKLRDGFGI
jgi:hypothetical protein